MRWVWAEDANEAAIAVHSLCECVCVCECVLKHVCDLAAECGSLLHLRTVNSRIDWGVNWYKVTGAPIAYLECVLRHFETGNFLYIFQLFICIFPIPNLSYLSLLSIKYLFLSIFFFLSASKGAFFWILFSIFYICICISFHRTLSSLSYLSLS